MNQNNYLKTEYNDPFIPNRADPYIMVHSDQKYYFTASVPEYDKIIIRRSDTLAGLREAEEVIVWRKHETGIMSTHIWAPELHFVKGKWYLYFAAGDQADVWNIRPYVLECSGDPLHDEWTELGQMQGADDFTFQDFSLDMTIFEHYGDWYCVWAEKVSVGKKISNLYISRMETPWKLATQQVLLSAPDYDWERVDFWVNEAPAVIKHNGRLYLTYSASATGECYCMGLLTIDENADLLDPSNWKKENKPVFTSDKEKGLYGPGHNTFLRCNQSAAPIMIYHARPYDEIIGDPLYDINRHAYLARVVWTDEGFELIAEPWQQIVGN